MATLALVSLAQFAGASFGLSAFATAALAAGASFLGSQIDNSLFAKHTTIQQEGPRLDEVRFQNSSEGLYMPIAVGRARLAGNIIWSTKFKEKIIRESETESQGGKSLGLGGSETTTETTTYEYRVSFAVAVCEGPISGYGRIWADGKLLKQSKYEIRKYKGNETQGKDPKIQAVEGNSRTSAYRGTAYVVFEDMLLEKFGNRIPQINIEIINNVDGARVEYEDEVKAINIGSKGLGEFTLATSEIIATIKKGQRKLPASANGVLRWDRGVGTQVGTDFDWTDTKFGGVNTFTGAHAYIGNGIQVDELTDIPQLAMDGEEIWKPGSFLAVSYDPATLPISGNIAGNGGTFYVGRFNKEALDENIASPVSADGGGWVNVDGIDYLQNNGQTTQDLWQALSDNNAFYINQCTPFFKQDVFGGPNDANVFSGVTIYGVLSYSNAADHQIALDYVESLRPRSNVPLKKVKYGKRARSENSNASFNLNSKNRTKNDDWSESIDQLEDVCTDLVNTSLTVSWFASSQDISDIRIEPKVTTKSFNTKPFNWKVSGTNRSKARVTNEFGSDLRFMEGTPADRSVFQAIQDLNTRNLKPVFYPSLIVDVGPEADDASGTTPWYPWRGSITSTNNGFPAVAGEISNIFGTATAADFNAYDNGTVVYTGTPEWSLRRMALHYAHICSAAGGVDTFILGSQMVGLNALRDDTDTHLAIAEWIALAAEVRIVLPTAKITYAADWREWSNFHANDGSGDITFHLDPLWVDTNIDVVAVDNFMPLADWRNDYLHLDRLLPLFDGSPSKAIHNLDYLKHNIDGGEFYDWTYASDDDRAAQVRTPITDPLTIEDWVFRSKDFFNWWSNTHHNRPAGVRDVADTGWVPESKPIWFTQLGCANVDKGANQPSIVQDLYSTDGGLPYFSNGSQSDVMSRQFALAHMGYWGDVANNPVSGSYAGSMIDTSRMYLHSWDARTFPEYPKNTSVFKDGLEWKTGYSLNGRLGLPTIAHFIEYLCRDIDVDLDTSALHGTIKGYIIKNMLSPREIIQPLMVAHSFDAFESEGLIKFKHRGESPSTIVDAEDLVYAGASDNLQGAFKLTKNQKADIPSVVRIKYISDSYHFRPTATQARRVVNSGNLVSENSYSMVMDDDQAQSVADTLLIDAHIMRENAELKLPPSMLRLDASDILNITLNDRNFDFRLEGLGYEYHRPAVLTRTSPHIYTQNAGPLMTRADGGTETGGVSETIFMDLPLLLGTEVPYAPWFAGSADPWPSAVVMYRSADGVDYSSDTAIGAPTVIGFLTEDLPKGHPNYWDSSNNLTVEISSFGTLSTSTEFQVFAGSNVGALYNDTLDAWEIVQWLEATLIAEDTYELSGLLRGQQGTELAMGEPLPEGSTFVLLDTSMVQSNMSVNLLNLELTWQYGPIADTLGDDSFTTQTFTPKGVGLRPYSPTSLSAAKDAVSNNIMLSWIRRTRIGGDLWDGADVPLSETSEAYEIDIYDITNTTVIRTIEVATQSFNYTSAEQVIDFGSIQTVLHFEVFQMSEIVGRGSGRKQSITFRF